MKVLGQGCHRVWGLSHHIAIKEEAIAINVDWVYNQACRLSHNIHAISLSYMIDDLFYLMVKEGFPTIILNL